MYKEEEYRKCAKDSQNLDARMFAPGGHVLPVNESEKNAILEEARRISTEFSRLSSEFLDSPKYSKKKLADIYFDWGIHCKQQAWFMYAFAKSASTALQRTIDLNQAAIAKMEQAVQLYPDEASKRESNNVLTKYKQQAAVLQAEALEVPRPKRTHLDLKVKTEQEEKPGADDGPYSSPYANWKFKRRKVGTLHFFVDENKEPPSTTSSSSSSLGLTLSPNRKD